MHSETLQLSSTPCPNQMPTLSSYRTLHITGTTVWPTTTAPAVTTTSISGEAALSAPSPTTVIKRPARKQNEKPRNQRDSKIERFSAA